MINKKESNFKSPQEIYPLLNYLINNNKDDFIKLKLKIGEFFIKRGEPAKGILLISKGILRITLRNEDNNKIFTIQNLKRGDIAGVDQIIRFSNDSEIAASTNVEGFFLDIDSFLKIITTNSKTQNLFLSISRYEIYSTLSKLLFKKSIKSEELLNFIKKYNFTDNIKLLPPGDNQLDLKFGKYFLSSNNIDGFEVGDIIEGPILVKITGNLPARLIKYENIVPNNFKKIYKDKNKESKIIADKKLDEIYKKQALEDYFGPQFDKSLYPHINGQDEIDQALACLRMIIRFFDKPFNKDLVKNILIDQFNSSKNKPISMHQFAAIFEILGCKTSPLNITDLNLLERVPLPALVLLNEKPKIIWTKKGNSFLISDPESNQHWIDIENLNNSKNNLYFLVIENIQSQIKKAFGFSWFFPVISKYKGTLFQVLISSFFVQLLALFNPLLIQQIFDAVISQGNLSSLNVLGTILISMALAQALLGSLRTFLFSDTSNRIDMHLGSSIIHHLLRLPFNYFSKRSVGALNGRINELEKIRRFLTSTAITIFLDAIFSIIYIGVMLIYSAKLTFLSLAVLPIFIFLTIIISPINKKQLKAQAESKALVQSHLVESLNGIETIKVQGMELYSQWRWEQLYSRQIKKGFNNLITNSIAASSSQFLSQLSGLIVVWGGAILVLNGEMTLGQLIAFRILAGYVTTPILRLTSTWQNFQDIALSIERLGDIINTQKESNIEGVPLPPFPKIDGHISFESVSFKFDDTETVQLSDISFKVKPGEFVAIVGSSGSGKSTLIKLLMRLYKPSNGVIKIDNNDINKFDLYSLRDQIGFVPQESLLFNGTIQSNISHTKPEASFEEIRTAAKIANADNFIQDLSRGYSNNIGERGFNISGGQKQRISIARMILKDPKLVILDEATSSLDSENEKIVFNNLLKKFKNRTVFFVTHKLDNMDLFNKILLIDKGKIIEEGNHQELMLKKGKYFSLINRKNKANLL